MATADAPRVHPEAVFTSLDPTSAAVLHLGTKRYYTLNETGQRIWQLLAQGGTKDEVASVLAEEYDIDLTTARRGVERFVDELRDEGLLEIGQG